MLDDTAIEKINDYIHAHPDEFEDGYAEKVSGRIAVVDDPTYPDHIFFDVVRHRACCGERYRPGEAMASFITYYERWKFDPAISEMKPLGVVKNSTWELHPDTLLDDFHFDISRQGENSYRIKEQLTREEATVTNLSEAEEFAAQTVRSLCFEGEFIPREDCLAPHQKEAFMADLLQAYVKLAKRQMRGAWELFHQE
jgi:hypothetical protein